MGDLSQDEIDALIAGAMMGDDDDAGDTASEAEAEVESEEDILEDSLPDLGKKKEKKPQGKIRDYDFSNPNPIPEDQKKTITFLHENFAQKLKVSLSAFLRSEVDISLKSVEQLTFAQYTNSLNSPTCIMSYDMPPLSGYGVIEVNAIIAYAVINRMLGGDGSVPSQVRPFTDVELAILRRLVDMLLNELEETWKPVINMHFTPKEMYTNPSLVKIIPMKEVTLIITFNMKIADSSGLVTICIPYSNLEPIAFKLGSKQWIKFSNKQSEDIQAAHQRNFLGLELETTAVLARFDMNMEDVLSLEKGDILDTGKKTKDPIILKIANRDKFEANPGLLGKHKALSIEKELIKE